MAFSLLSSVIPFYYMANKYLLTYLLTYLVNTPDSMYIEKIEQNEQTP